MKNADICNQSCSCCEDGPRSLRIARKEPPAFIGKPASLSQRGPAGGLEESHPPVFETLARIDNVQSAKKILQVKTRVKTRFWEKAVAAVRADSAHELMSPAELEDRIRVYYYVECVSYSSKIRERRALEASACSSLVVGGGAGKSMTTIVSVIDSAEKVNAVRLKRFQSIPLRKPACSPRKIPRVSKSAIVSLPVVVKVPAEITTATIKTSIAEPAEKAVNIKDPVTVNLPAADRVIVRKAVRKAVNIENPVTMDLPTTLRVEEPQIAPISAPVLPVEIPSSIVSAPEAAPRLVEMADPLSLPEQGGIGANVPDASEPSEHTCAIVEVPGPGPNKSFNYKCSHPEHSHLRWAHTNGFWRHRKKFLDQLARTHACPHPKCQSLPNKGVFASAAQLFKHIESRHGTHNNGFTESYRCPVCTSKYSSCNAFSQHLSTKHKGMKMGKLAAPKPEHQASAKAFLLSFEKT